MFRMLIFLVLLAVAVDYFVYDSRYLTGASQYVQRVGWSLNHQVVKILDRGR
jgi:hypothetical protein